MGAFIIALLVALAQMMLMLVGTILLHISNRAAMFIYENFSFLESYVPALYRYRAVFGQTKDFDIYFSVRLFQIALQLLIMAVLTVILLRDIGGRRPEPLGFLKELMYVAVLLVFVFPPVELFCGSYDMAYPVLFISENADSFVRCLALPAANLFLFFFIGARFWEPNYTRLARYRIGELEPTAYSEAIDNDSRPP